jgi:hypothetical protein
VVWSLFVAPLRCHLCYHKTYSRGGTYASEGSVVRMLTQMLHRLIITDRTVHFIFGYTTKKILLRYHFFFIFFDTHTKESSRFQKLRLFILALYRRSFFMKIRPLVAYLLILYVFSTLTIKIRISLYLLWDFNKKL